MARDLDIAMMSRGAPRDPFALVSRPLAKHEMDCRDGRGYYRIALKDFGDDRALPEGGATQEVRIATKEAEKPGLPVRIRRIQIGLPWQ